MSTGEASDVKWQEVGNFSGDTKFQKDRFTGDGRRLKFAESGRASVFEGSERLGACFALKEDRGADGQVKTVQMQFDSLVSLNSKLKN